MKINFCVTYTIRQIKFVVAELLPPQEIVVVVVVVVAVVVVVEVVVVVVVVAVVVDSVDVVLGHMSYHKKFLGASLKID